MEKKNLDWSNLGFEYIQTDKRYVSNYKDGKWDDGSLTSDANVVLNECAGVFQYAQTVFEGLKAYTTEDGRISSGLKCRAYDGFRKEAGDAGVSERSFPRCRHTDCQSKCSVGASVWFWCDPLCPAVHARVQSGDRRQSGKRVSVSYFDHSGRTIF